MQKPVYRIIDANFNRAREAARVIEEYCRFVLENQPLTARAKGLRHRLCTATALLGTENLIFARDAAGDIGKGMQVDGQMARRQLPDIAIAACKRLTEALRALAETTAIVNPQVAAAFETLRFEAYTLEQEIALAADPRQRFAHVRLYVLINAGPQHTDDQILRLAKQCAAGGADCLQLRAKSISDARLLELAQSIVRISREHKVISIINDRVDIAIAAGADGVHLGQDDLPLSAARKIAPKPMIFGISTHNCGQLEAAIALNPTYIALGPAFATATKPHEPSAGPEYLRPAAERLTALRVPFVAIGGIDAENLDEVLAWGVEAVAVCSAITGACDPAVESRLFLERLANRA